MHSEQLLKKFFSHIEKIPFHSCHEWVGHHNNKGYGQFGFERKNYFAHRLSWPVYGRSKPRVDIFS